jgi:hypothetical protein
MAPERSSRALSVPGPHEWERIKNVVHKLYVTEKRPLRDVKAILLSEHGFNAT